MNYEKDKRIVMTLDAGGTNFVFSAIQGNKEIVEPIRLDSNAHDLELCLDTMIKGFSQVQDKLTDKPVAISFAFPGPADYPRGIIGDLGNLPAFRGGVALAAMLEKEFNLPVYINNDGNLYAYGEALAGFLPMVNQKLADAGSPKRFKNLVGFTLGTGFGAGIVIDGKLIVGDNSNAGEVWLLRNKLMPDRNAEESVSIRAVQREYAKAIGISFDDAPTPKDIYDIATGKIDGNQAEAIKAFKKMAEALGDAISNVLTLIDGVAVLGGGVAGAHEIFLPAVVDEMNGTYAAADGSSFPRLVTKTYNLEKEAELAEFCQGEKKSIKIPRSDETIEYDPAMRVGIGISRIGTSKAIAIGAYSYALSQLDK